MWWTGFILFSNFGNFFQHVKKILNFWDVVNIRVNPTKLDHLGFYCKYSLQSKIEIKISGTPWCFCDQNSAHILSRSNCMNGNFFKNLSIILVTFSTVTTFMTKNRWPMNFENFWVEFLGQLAFCKSKFLWSVQWPIILIKKFIISISIDISMKTHQFVCIR